MKFSHDYLKLEDNIYTTIRRYKKGNIGDFIVDKSPNIYNRSKIIRIKRNSLDNLPLDLLQRDTTYKDNGIIIKYQTRKEIYELFQSFYKKPIDFKNEKFYIYWMEKI